MTEHESQDIFLKRVRSALGLASNSARDPRLLIEEGPTPEALALAEQARSRSDEKRKELVESLTEIGDRVKLMVRTVPTLADVPAALSAIAAEQEPEWNDAKPICAWRHPLLEKCGLAQACEAMGSALTLPPEADSAGETDEDAGMAFRQAASEAFLGVTALDWVVAESCTMILRAGPGRPRTTSLLPSVHVAVCTMDQVLADFQEAYALLHMTHNKKGQDYESGPATGVAQSSFGGLPNGFFFISGPSKTADIEAHMVHGAHGPRAAYLLVIEKDA